MLAAGYRLMVKEETGYGAVDVAGGDFPGSPLRSGLHVTGLKPCGLTKVPLSGGPGARSRTVDRREEAGSVATESRQMVA